MQMAGDSGPGPAADLTLEVVAGPGIGRRIAVGSGGVVLGRGSRAALAFSDDSLISQRHATISQSGDGAVAITDLGSTNGTFVNGARITGPTKVTSTDVIGLGKTELRLVGAQVSANHRDQARGTVVAPRQQPSLDPWVSWIRETFASHPSVIESATNAAMAAIARGANTDEIARAAHVAANKMAAAESANAWSAWAQQSYAGDPRRIQAATEAALSAIARGANTDQASAAARAAADAAAPAPAAAGLPGRAAGGGRPPRAMSPSMPYSGGWIRGCVTGYQQRYEGQVGVWNFQLERRRSDGRPAGETLAIEMRGFGFRGAIKEGDEVEVFADNVQPGKVNRVRRVRNLTSNSMVTVRGHPTFTRWRFKVQRIIVITLILVGLAILALFIIGHIRGGSP
jgi:hypothetical protein